VFAKWSLNHCSTIVHLLRQHEYVSSIFKTSFSAFANGEISKNNN
jgi:hypothetical protein